MSKIWTADEIVEVINNNDDQLCKALLKLYERQTADEKESKDTRVHNNVGFTAYDARFLSSLAEGYKKYGRLTPKQISCCRRRIVRYRRQLVDIANRG